MIWKSLATCFFVRIDKGYIILANNSQGYKSKVEYWKYKKRSIANALKLWNQTLWDVQGAYIKSPKLASLGDLLLSYLGAEQHEHRTIRSR